MNGNIAAIIAVMVALCPMAAHAEARPESLDQLEPERGEWEIEWFGSFGGDGEQEVEILHGLSDRVAIGGEIEFEGPGGGLEFESASAVMLYRFSDPSDDPVGLGVKGEAAIARGGKLARLEARAIAEVQTPRWWLQGNVILRHAREDGERGTGLAYAASLQTQVAGAWLGIEATGQAARLSGDPDAAPRGNHYAGPSLTFERDIGEDAEIEIGLAWLQRLKGNGAGSGPRVFVQFLF
jgi:hypothetical protein